MDIDYYIGGIVLLPYTSFNPIGWLPCEGQVLQVAQYQPLFSLIGYTFGGNGSTTFALPDLRGAVPISGMKYFIAITGLYPSRS